MRLRTDARDRLIDHLEVPPPEGAPRDPAERAAAEAWADEILALITLREAGDPLAPGVRHLGDGTYRVGPLRGQRVRSPITGRFKKGQNP